MGILFANKQPKDCTFGCFLIDNGPIAALQRIYKKVVYSINIGNLCYQLAEYAIIKHIIRQQKEKTRMNRRLARLRAVQALFQIDLTAVEWKEALSNSLEDSEEITPFLEKIVSGTLSHQEEIDGILSKNLSNWSLDRVGNVDRAVLRMAVHEMKYIDDIPMNVTFNEAIELAKAFGGEESGRFVNGVLSKVVEAISKEEN